MCDRSHLAKDDRVKAEWLSPLKILENYVQPALSDFDKAERDLHIAVITGQVRARFQGEIIGPELRAQIARSVYDPKSPAALPPDIEISVEDAERVWLQH